ncbi:MAG: hemerythrin domain-containing protein [Pseudomonadota bacterium]|nr:hemerythrin domain-containing protein [Pseudomonadota bacterium]
MSDSSPSVPIVDHDAIALLQTDHDELADLFERYAALAADGVPADERQDAAEELCSFLLVHATIKEEVFYPAVREVIDEEYLIDEALIELDSARALIDEIQSGDPTQPRYDTQVKILQEILASHFEGERNELFPRLRETSLDLEELGADLECTSGDAAINR